MMDDDKKNGLAEEFGAIQASESGKPGDIIDLSERLFGGKESSERWRLWFDLYYIEAVDTSESFGELVVEAQEEKLPENLEERLPSVEEYRESLDFVEAKPLEMGGDWHSYTLDGETVSLPMLPAEYAQEHFERHGYETEVEETELPGGWRKELKVEEENEWGDARTKVSVTNDSTRCEDDITIEGEFGYPSFLDSPFFRERNWQNYLESLRNRRMEPLLADIENIYGKARTAVTEGIDIAEYVKTRAPGKETEALDLLDVTRERNASRADDWEPLTPRDAVRKARDRVVHETDELPETPSKGHYGDMSAERLALPLMDYLEGGREGRVAPLEYLESGNTAERAKVRRGNVLAEIYFDALEQFGEARHGEKFDEPVT